MMDRRDYIFMMAYRFSKELREQVGSETLATIAALSNSYGIACPSHDYCDANEHMITAFRMAYNRDADPASEWDAEMINQAWSTARRHGYFNDVLNAADTDTKAKSDSDMSTLDRAMWARGYDVIASCATTGGRIIACRMRVPQHHAFFVAWQHPDGATHGGVHCEYWEGSRGAKAEYLAKVKEHA